MVRYILIGLSLFATVFLIGCAEPAQTQSPPVVRSAECRWASGPIKIDGVINDTAWDNISQWYWMT